MARLNMDMRSAASRNKGEKSPKGGTSGGTSRAVIRPEDAETSEPLTGRALRLLALFIGPFALCGCTARPHFTLEARNICRRLFAFLIGEPAFGIGATGTHFLFHARQARFDRRCCCCIDSCGHRNVPVSVGCCLG